MIKDICLNRNTQKAGNTMKSQSRSIFKVQSYWSPLQRQSFCHKTRCIKKKKNEQKGRRSRTESSRMSTNTGEKGKKKKTQQETEQSKTKCTKPNQTPERGYLESKTQQHYKARGSENLEGEGGQPQQGRPSERSGTVYRRCSQVLLDKETAYVQRVQCNLKFLIKE